MKLECEVISVETRGDSLRIGLQGTTRKAAEWRRNERQEIVIPASDASARVFYVGRKVSIVVKAAQK